MRKIITIVLIFLISLSSVFSFSISEFETKRNDYKILLQKKVSKKLAKLDTKILEKLDIKIKERISLVENSEKITDSKKLNSISMLYALSDLVNEQISGDNIVEIVENKEEYSVLVIDDKRCTDCQTNNIVLQLKQLPVLISANFEIKDFGDEGIEDYLKENNITKLPAVIFEKNEIDANVNPYLVKIDSGEYSLQMGSQFDPFIERTEKGFMVLDKEKYNTIKNNSYIKGDKDAKITWIEYSDLECPYCAKLHNNGTYDDLKEKHGDDLNNIYNHFPLDFHKNALTGALILECIGAQSGSSEFYEMLDKSYIGRDFTNSEDNSEKSSKEFLVKEAVELGIDEDKLEKCVTSEIYLEKVNTQYKNGVDIFGITGTPGNVLINNETLEYTVISGAYPTSSFEAVIDKLLE